MMKAPIPDATPSVRQSELVWQRFWGQYDAVMELGCMRQSVNMNHEHADQIEKMFVESLSELQEAAGNLVQDYKKNQEKK